MMETDIELLRRYADHGAEEAFAALVGRRIDIVYAAALRQLGGAVHRAEEVVQSVFIQLARNAAAVARRDDLLGWLYIATHHAAANLKRTEARRQTREHEALTMQPSQSDLPDEAAWEQLRPVLDEAMLELSESDRRAILLRYFENARFAGLGRELGVSEDAARMRVERALEKLRVELGRRGITSTSTALATVLARQVAVAAPAGLAESVTNAALAGAASGAAFSMPAFFMSTTSVVTLAIAAAAAGAAAYQLRQPPAATEAASALTSAGEVAAPPAPVIPAASAAAQSAAPALVAQDPGRVVGRVVVGGKEVLLRRAPGSMTANPNAPVQLALADVLGPDNSYHDDAFGISVAVPEGWAVRDAFRWGDGHRHNTVNFVPNAAVSVSSNMYYKLYHADEVVQRTSSAGEFLRDTAVKKEALRVTAFPDYRNVPESFSFEPVNGAPAMSYFATFTKGDVVMTEFFVRVLGPKGYVMFFTTGRLEDVRPVMAQIQQMAKSVRIP